MNHVARIIAAVGVVTVLAGAAIYLLHLDTKVPGHQQSQAGMPERDMIPAAGVELSQGVSGRVLTPAGTPCANAEVVLMPGGPVDAIQVFLDNQRGLVASPVSRGRTGEDGRFRLATAEVDAVHDLRVVTDHFPELHHRSFRIWSGEWYEAGDLRLDTGIVVQGTVLRAGSLVPVAGAHVFLHSNHAAHSLPATGRERGTPALTDDRGFFQFTKVPRDTTIKLVAEAPGFARVEKLNLVLQQETVNRFEIELPAGLPLAGIVRNVAGAPMANARVSVGAIGAVQQAGQTTTDRAGRFALEGLREGPYFVAVDAPLHEPKRVQPVSAGNTDVTIVLEQRGMARVRVLARDGSAITDFNLSLKRLPDDPIGIGNVAYGRRITAADFQDGVAVIGGIPDGTFVLQVAAARHASTRSAPFTVVTGGKVPDVTVQMTLGGVIKGRVRDELGVPVAGAWVGTRRNRDWSHLESIFSCPIDPMPDLITKVHVTSGVDGRFRLPMLMYGEYMLHVACDRLLETDATDITIAADAEVDVGDLTLVRGTLVRGACSLDGRPTGQINVTIVEAGVAAPADDRAKPRFWATTRSDNDGSYRLHKRVPPGTYRIHANRETGHDFQVKLDVEHTARELVVRPGQEEILQEFRLSQ